jgi:hypothetical protein
MVAEFPPGVTSRKRETTQLRGSFERQHERSRVALEHDPISGGIALDDPCGSVGPARRRLALGGYGPIAGKPAVPNGGGDDRDGHLRRGVGGARQRHREENGKGQKGNHCLSGTHIGNGIGVTIGLTTDDCFCRSLVCSDPSGYLKGVLADL